MRSAYKGVVRYDSSRKRNPIMRTGVMQRIRSLRPVEKSRFFFRPRQPACLGRRENCPMRRVEHRREAVEAEKERIGKERSDEEISGTDSKQTPPEYAHPAVESPVPNLQPLILSILLRRKIIQIDTVIVYDLACIVFWNSRKIIRHLLT